MEKEFVPYELAVKLKELGFDEPCFGHHYYNTTVQKYKVCLDHCENQEDADKELGILAPTFSQAFRWFREKYNLYHVIIIADLGKYESGNPDFQCAIYSKDPVVITKMDNYKSYEEAELACLNKLIELTYKPK